MLVLTQELLSNAESLSLKSDVMPKKSSENEHSIRINNVKKFAKQFVQSIIDEAIKQSSQTTWLIHCSENCHRMSGIQLKQQKGFLCWTPECNQSENQEEDINHDFIIDGKDAMKYALSCNSLDIASKSNTMNDDIYALPIDTIHTCSKGAESCHKHYKTLPNCSKYLKPKAIHALNLFKSNHQKTFSDFKLFLLNLYTSNDISVKTIGSERSAFTTYCRRNNFANDTNVGNVKDGIGCDHSDYERFEKTLRLHKNEENLKLRRIKNEKELIKPVRKCKRIKRRNFFNLKHSFSKVFKSHKSAQKCLDDADCATNSIKDRSLPPLPRQTVYAALSCEGKDDANDTGSCGEEHDDDIRHNFQMKKGASSDLNKCVISRKKLVDFASNIEKVKDYGWYWGPMSSKAAEKLLSNEPDGSFIVRDSSDDRYIFSLTFKLNACIRHVRIEHGQGNFSFGCDTNFKSDTIVDFIENAVQHSRSGRYLFFIHRRPILGPMRVLLLYPVSRFKGHVPSLQHMCRFVILKTVRRDLISSLPLPKPLLDYLSSKDYYTEQSF